MSDIDLETFCPLCDGWMGGKRQVNAPTCDHFMPRALLPSGGFRGTVNLWNICFRCNVKKTNKLPDARQTAVYSITKGFCSIRSNENE